MTNCSTNQSTHHSSFQIDDYSSHYTDLSQSIASSKCAESFSGLLGSGSIGKDVRIITPISMVSDTSTSNMKSNSNQDIINGDPSSSSSSTSSKDTVDSVNGGTLGSLTPFELDESSSSDHSTLSSSQDSPSLENSDKSDSQDVQSSDDIIENFGEIIKKTMVETVTAW